ncbi:MAG: Phosphomethylpyrimidine kinase [Bacteroidota bacterium]|jgi:hydroxymethylpyrimidine/phosphomethylpyrimidine kinase|nr:Phosphomethylpyrimidine kinase [Bacteroidota bacterium]
MKYTRPIVLSIAGFDPCGGAGVLADTKTFEQHQCLGMAVISGITKQVEDRFISVEWVDPHKIIDDIRPLFEKYTIEIVKIGIIENLNTIQTVVNFLKLQNPNVKIVWDPVLAASSGFKLMNALNQDTLNSVLQKIYLVTPNVNEARTLSGDSNETTGAEFLASLCHVLLKGGHSHENEGTDFLFADKKKIKIEKRTNHVVYPKHGSGCILSSAIAAELAIGNDLESACKNAKEYVEKILNSNPNLLAYHVA